MAPLIALGIAILPSIARFLVGDRAGQIAESVTRAIQEITGTEDPTAAKQKLDADPAAATALRVRLAEIALDAERLHVEAETAARRAEYDTLAAHLADTGSARTTMAALAQSGSSIAWGAPMVSGLVTVGFFCIVGSLMILNTRFEESTAALVNITVGALGAAFTAVVNFWIGSSQGSREKDVTVRQLASQGVTQAGQSESRLAAALGRTTQAPLGIAANLAGSARFPACLAEVLRHEGGYVNHPQDPGGPTNYGITQATLADFRGHPVTAEQVQALTVAEAGEIYRANYWNRLRCDDLPPGLDLMVFDFGVNAGPGASARLLQRALGVRDDGAIGPITLSAARTVDPVTCIERLAETRDAFYRRISTFPTFGRGWLKRTAAVRRLALTMAA